MLLIEMLDANEDGEVDSFEWTTMLRQVCKAMDANEKLMTLQYILCWSAVRHHVIGRKLAIREQ